jgi:hypothetical protein
MVHRFTPVHADTDIRLELELDDENIKRIRRGPDWHSVVRDTTGQFWLVHAAPCDIPTCYCDAIALELTEVVA